jgi:hypothetical protein
MPDGVIIICIAMIIFGKINPGECTTEDARVTVQPVLPDIIGMPDSPTAGDQELLVK